MPSKILSEFVVKNLYNKWIKNESKTYAIVRENINIDQIKTDFQDQINTGFHFLDQKFVVKVDQQVKGRMKKGLVKLGLTIDQISDWINTVDNKYTNFIVEPYVENVSKETYLLIRNNGMKVELIVILSGGINVGNIDQMDNVPKIELDYGENLSVDSLDEMVGENKILVPYIQDIFAFYQKYHLTFLEINPLAIVNDSCVPLDMLAKYDSCSLYLWDMNDKLLVEQSLTEDNVLTDEEKYIEALGQKTGSSLKFKLLNPNSRVWFILFGGGASVCYFDKWMKIVSKNEDLMPANYGELSGNPSREFVYEYIKQIFYLIEKSQMTSDKPFYLIIGGGIANFTLVDKTFLGIVDAINECHDILFSKNVHIFVRRGGPNYLTGLKILTDCCKKYNIKCDANGPEKPMTQILDEIYNIENNDQEYPIEVYNVQNIGVDTFENMFDTSIDTNVHQFTNDTTCIIFGSQTGVAQNMLDFDMEVGRITPSVTAFVDPSRRSITNIQLFWKNKSILVPIYPNIDLAVKNHPNVSGMVNFASFRTAFESTKHAFMHDNIKFVSILAEGMAENQTKELVLLSKKMNKMLLGPSTIGAIFPGSFRIGNAGGKLDYLINTRLHIRGNVGIVTRSGGLLNELCHMTSKVKLGISSAIAIGGDRYTGTNFADVVKFYEKDENTKLIVLLGEIGGLQEMEVANLVKKRLIRKPIIGLCLGSSADYLASDIQFGHAGADAHNKYEKASFKNSYMASCGIHVPSTWEEMETIMIKIAERYGIDKYQYEPQQKLVMSFDEAHKSGTVRKQPNFFSSISNEKNHEVTYNQVPISAITGVGDVIGHLWFKKNLPKYLTQYYEKILVICADHGPCVSGAQNTMITTRAGKDLVSSLCSGLLTIGPKFGGAINEAAYRFYYGMKNKKTPQDFIREVKIIPGIGHKHYNIYQPDNRVKLLEEHVDKYFTSKETISYARSIENITLQKKHNLILNVDGFIAASMVDGFISAGFSEDEIEEILNNDILNSFFVLSRTIGFIGHHIDQKRLKQDLYRAPEYDVAYL
ncbi:putative ATP-citrate synthase isoform X3 [Tupanvirus deep ocean]|uniref:ATP-citrate synthase isoform X3 n=2 Tax=Tupanvirus TaxID=2094720 RepID=A0AC62A946_9VIRU|nr:putative ATP-citrate synthase isoform X3 [Tupanvirus deep ocean]QKU34311.1 putative ATP-citrate synthase isoform X3 [Tupanvirus deep ocean]